MHKGRFNIDGAWYQFGRKQGISFAKKEKLVAPEISLGGNFAYDQYGQFYSTTTVYGYIKKPEVDESYQCLIAIMNSQLFWWYLVNTGTVLANGYFRYKPNYIKPFPLPLRIPANVVGILEKQVEEINKIRQNNPNENCDDIEARIDDIIFDIYNLTEEERQYVKSV